MNLELLNFKNKYYSKISNIFKSSNKENINVSQPGWSILGSPKEDIICGYITQDAKIPYTIPHSINPNNRLIFESKEQAVNKIDQISNNIETYKNKYFAAYISDFNNYTIFSLKLNGYLYQQESINGIHYMFISDTNLLNIDNINLVKINIQNIDSYLQIFTKYDPICVSFEEKKNMQSKPKYIFDFHN